MTTTTTDAQARAMLAAIPGLNLDGDVIAAKITPSAPAHKLAPAGVDPRTMPVTEIVFDKALLDGFPDLEKQRKEAADYVFGIYKSPGRNKERNAPLWGAVGKFITATNLERKVPGAVAQQARISTEQKALLAALAQMGIHTVNDLTALLGQGA